MPFQTQLLPGLAREEVAHVWQRPALARRGEVKGGAFRLYQQKSRHVEGGGEALP